MANEVDVTAHEDIDLEKLLHPDTDTSGMSKGNDFVPDGESTAPAASGADTTTGGGGEDTATGATGEDANAQPRDEKGKFIPKARFDEVSTRARDAAARVEQLEARLREREEAERAAAAEKDKFDPVAVQKSLDELTEAHTAAILDGKSKEAGEIMRKIVATSRSLSDAEAKATAGQARFQAAEEIRIELVLDELEEKYPELNQNDAKFDKNLSRAVYEAAVDIQAGRGIPLSRALLQAAPKVFLERENKELREQLEALKSGKPVKSEKGNSRGTNVEKNTEAANATAPNANTVGVDADKAGTRSQKVEVTKLTPEEYDALPAATKARVRGDNHVPS